VEKFGHSGSVRKILYAQGEEGVLEMMTVCDASRESEDHVCEHPTYLLFNMHIKAKIQLPDLIFNFLL